MTGSPFFKELIRRKIFKAIFISVSPFQKLMKTVSLYFGTSLRSFLNLLFYAIRMSPVTICPWFRSVNGDVVHLQDKLFVFSKMSLVSNVFINSLWLNILDRIVLDNVYTGGICSVLLSCVVMFSSRFYQLLFY